MRKKSTILLIVLMVAMLGSMVYFGTMKQGYHVDEIYSYGLANSEYLPFLHFGYHEYNVKDWMNEYGPGGSLVDLCRNLVKDFRILKENGFNWRESSIYQDYLVAQESSNDRYTPTWVAGQYFMDYLSATKESSFNYGAVYYNQRGDVHPPLYYILLHTVCSLFLGEFSKWFGLSINFVVMILTMLLLYATAKKYLGGEVVALSSVAMYALSAACMTNVIFIRMYVMFTFFVVLVCNVHLRIVKNAFELSKKECLLLALVTLGGFLTHYYYVFFGIMIAFVMVIWMAIGKHWKSILRYVFTLAGTAVLGVCVWPFAIKHIFFGYRGTPTWELLLNGEFNKYIASVIFDQMAGALVGGKAWIFAVAGLMGVLALLFSKKRKQYFGKAVLITLPVVGFSILISQLVPIITDRYIMAVYPMLCVLMMGSVYCFCKEIIGLWKVKSPQKWIGISVACATVLLMVLNSCYSNPVDNLTTAVQETVQVPDGMDCIYILDDGEWNQSTMDATILAKCRNVGVAYYSDAHVLAADYAYQAGDYLMIAIQKEMEVDEILAEMRVLFGVEDLDELYRTYGNTAVRVVLKAK